MDNKTVSGREKESRRITLIGLVINLFLTAIKLIGGGFLRSTSLIADGVHSISDLVTDWIVLLGLRIANRPADETHPYGHKKFESVFSFLIGLVLLYVSVQLTLSSLQAVIQRRPGHSGWIVLVIAGISVVLKESLFQVTRRIARKTGSPALYANAWHHRSDAASSVAVLFGAAAGMLGWEYGDSSATAIVALMIAAVAVKIMLDAVKDITDHSAGKECQAQIEDVLNSEKDVCGWHALRTRKIGDEVFIDLHLLCDPELTVSESHSISVRIEDRLKSIIRRPVHILIHIEPDVPKEHPQPENS
jgi:cation diffusion facilitator family transporter